MTTVCPLDETEFVLVVRTVLEDMATLRVRRAEEGVVKVVEEREWT